MRQRSPRTLFRYTKEQASKIRAILDQAGRDEKREWASLLKEITHVVISTLAKSASEKKPFRQAVDAKLAEYIRGLGDVLKAHGSLPLETQHALADCELETLAPELVASLRPSERAALPTVKKLLGPARFSLLLTALINHAAQPRIVRQFPETGRQKDDSVRWAVRELWGIYEHATGQEPRAYPLPYGQSGYGFGGHFHRFAKAVLLPARLTDENLLSSQIHTAYQEWRSMVRPPTSRRNIRTKRV